MLNLQDQSGRPKTVLREPCAVSHDEETLHVSTTACVGQNISTQESMLHSDSVQETETTITTLVENHQTDSSAVAGPASTILSTMSSIKLRDIMEKMTSCLFGWSWRQVSLFDLTGKNTDADEPTVYIPCTDIVPVAVQELFFPCSLLEDTMSCDQEVEELMAITPPPSLDELELCLRLAGIYDITACLSVVFRPECIVQVDCSVENFEAIADRMTVIGLPLPIRSPASTLAIVPPQSSTVQEDQTVECDNQEMVLSLLEDTTGYNQVQVIQSMVIPTQPRTAEIELRLQLPGVGDVTDSLRVVFRPECIVQVDCSMVNFEAIADHMRDIGLRVPTRSTDSTLAIMPPQSLIVEEVLTSEIQPVDCDNYDMALVVPQGPMQSINQEAVEHPSLPALTAVEETETVNIDEICSLFASMSGHNTKQPPMKSASKVLKGSEIFFGKAVDPRARDGENHVQDPDQGNIASCPNEAQAIEPLLVQSQPRTAELELRLQLPGVCDITGRLRVVFRPECIVLVDLSILRFEALGDDIREIDLQLPMDAIANSLVAVSSQPITVQEVTTSEVQPVEQSSIPALPAKAKAKAEAIDIKEFYSLLASMSGHDKVPSANDVDDSKESERFIGEAVQRVKHNDVQGETTIRNNEVQVIESLVVHSQPGTAELELRLQLPEVCNMTGRLRVVFRPERIVQVDLSILRFEALSDDIREIDLQLPMDAIVNALAAVSSQQITVQEVTTSEAQPVEHSSIPAQPAKAKPEAIDIKEFYSLLASLASHAEESSHEVAELKGSPLLCELEIAPTDEEIEDFVAIEPAEGLKPLHNANDLQNVVWKETTVNAQRDFQQKEPVNAVPILPTEGIKLHHVIISGLPEVSVEKQPTLEQTVSEITVSSPSPQEVQASDRVTTVCQALKTKDVYPTSNVLEEVVAREIREIRETVDNTVGGIRDVPLERPTVIRRRKRSHADDNDDNQFLSKHSEFEERVAKALVLDGIQESPLVTNGAQRYPSDVYQALLTQTVNLLERGIVLLSDDGSFIAVANPSAASRIGDAITRHTFAQNFHRYDNDVLTPDLKQKVIERAAVVAREHQDRVLEGMVERPIFTLSEIRHYDCNGDYIMEDVSSPNPPVYPFTGTQTTPVHQGLVNPFLSGMTPQSLLTTDMHTSFQLLQHYQYINDIEMIDVEELYMDVDESIDDMFMECDDQEYCHYCSQISLSLFASLPTKYAIRRRAIYSLLDKKPLNPEIPSCKINQGTKKSWFAYNTFSFRPEFDQPLGDLSRKDRVIYSLLDERSLNPVLTPSLAKQSKSKSWIAYNTFSFREGDLVPVGSNCDCMQTRTAVEPWPEPKQVSNPVFPGTSEENIDTAKSPFNIFNFKSENHSSQQTSIFGGMKQTSVFSFGKTEPPVPSTEPETVSSAISWKDFSFREEDVPQTDAENSSENDQQSLYLLCKPETPTLTTISSGISWKEFSFREEDDPQTEAENSSENDQQSLDLPGKPETPTLTTISPGISWKDFSCREDDPLFQAEADKSFKTKQQPIDFSLETEKQSGNKETLTFSCEKGEEATFPVREDSDAANSETESHDDDLFDLNDENEEQTMKEIIAAVKSKLDESRMYYRPQEDVAQVSSKGESGKVDETASKVEPVNKQLADRQTNLEATDNEEKKAQKDGTGQSQEANQVSKDPSEAAKQEKCSSLESREPASKLTISHSKSFNKRSEPYPTQAVSGLTAFMRRRVKMVERDRLRTLQVLTQVTLEDKDADPSEPVHALPADNAQQRKDVSLKSLTGSTKTKSSSKPDLTITMGPSEAEKRKVVSLKSTTGNKQTRSSSKPDLTITIGPSEAEKRKVVSLKSTTGNQQTRSSSKPDLAITIGPSDTHERKVVSSRTLVQDKKADLPKAPSVQSDVNSSNKKISLKSLTQTKKKEADSKGSEMDRLKSRHQSKVADVLSKPTPTTSAGSETLNNIKRVSFVHCEKTERESSTPSSVPSDGENRGNVISLRSVVQNKKTDPIIKSSSSESQAEIKDASSKPLNQTKEEQKSEPSPKERSSQPAPLKLMPRTSSPKADSMSNPITSDAEHKEVVSLNPLPKYINTEAPSKTICPTAPTSSVVQETKGVSLKSLTQDAVKKDDRENKSVATVLQVASSVKESKESCDVVKDDVNLSKPSTQCKKMYSLKEHAASEAERFEISTKHDSVKRVEQSKTVDLPKETIPSKPLSAVKVQESKMVSLKSLTRGSKSEPRNNAAVASPPASTAAESSAKKASFKSTDDEEKERGPGKSFSSTVQVCAETNAKTVAMETVSGDSLLRKTNSMRKFTFGSTKVIPKPYKRNSNVISLKPVSPTSSVQTSGSAKEAELTSTASQKEDLTKTSPSTKPVSCKRNINVVSSKSVSSTSSVQTDASTKEAELTSTASKKEDLTKTSPSTKPVSCKRNVNVVSLKSVSPTSSVQTDACTKEAELTLTATQKEDLTKTSPSTKPVSCKRNVNVVSLKSVSQTSSVQTDASTKEAELTSTAPQKKDLTKTSPSTKPVSRKRNINAVPLKSVSQSEKDGSLCKPSSSKSPSSCDEQENQLMSFKSVTKREWAVPVRRSSGNTSVLPMEACAVTPTADVKIDGSAKVDDQLDPVVIQPSSSDKRKTFESLTSSHKRELDEMLEEDQQSDKERLRNFTSRAGQKYSRKTTRKENVQPKSVGNYNSGDGERKNTSEADKDVKLVKTDVVQDTSVAKGIPVTKKELQPISLTVDVNKVKDAKNESTQQWVPGTLKETKPSTERRPAVTDVTNSNTTQSRQATTQQSSLTSLAAVGTDTVGECGGSAVQSSQAIPDPRPLPPAEAAEGIVAQTVNTVNILQSSPSTVPTTTEPSVNNIEGISEEESNMAVCVETKDISETPRLRDPRQSASMDLVKEPLCLAGVVAISGDNQANSVKIPEPVPQPAAENVTPAGKRKLHDMQQEEDEKIPSIAEEKPVERRKKRRWRTEEKTPEKQEEQPNKPRRRIVRNMFKKG